MTSNPDLIINLKPTQTSIRIADKKKLVSEGYEQVYLSARVDKGIRKVILDRVLYVPDLGRVSLLSWKAIERKGDYRLFGWRGQLRVFNNKNENVLRAKDTNRSYIVQIENIEVVCATYKQWHEALCHPASGIIDLKLYENQVFSVKPKNF